MSKTAALAQIEALGNHGNDMPKTQVGQAIMLEAIHALAFNVLHNPACCEAGAIPLTAMLFDCE